MVSGIRERIIVVIVALGLFIGVGLIVALFGGHQIYTTISFAFGWHHIADQQQEFVRMLTVIVRETNLPLENYQLTEHLPQRRGQERWQRQTHTIRISPITPLATLAERIQALGSQNAIQFLTRDEHLDATMMTSRLIFGKAGVITDIVMLFQTRAIAQFPSSLSLLPPPKTMAFFPKPLLQSSPPSLAVRSLPAPQLLPPQIAAVQPLQPMPAPLPSAPLASRPPAAGTTGHPQIALVIDDLGWDSDAARTLLALGISLSLAILPEAPHGGIIAQEAQQQHCEILLHLPMEPHGAAHIDLGPYGLRSIMTASELTSRVEAALEAVPAALGVNNHMGSRLTEDRLAMRTVMQLLKRHHLFFLDSRTSKDSLAYQVAQELGVRAAQRQVFLDTEEDPGKIAQQLQRLVAVAQQQGHAIGIGHPHPSTLKVLQQRIPLLRQAGIQFVPISQLLD